MEECGLLVQKAEQMRKDMNRSSDHSFDKAVNMVGTISTSRSDSYDSQEDNRELVVLSKVMIDSYEDERVDGDEEEMREGEISMLAKEQKELLKKLVIC